MKCPKCGFISFDYNETCPKCKKDISGEREKMHHVAFRPDVPFLIGALIGETDGSRTKLEVHEHDILMPLDSGVFDMERASGEESLEINLDAAPEPGQTMENFLPVEGEEIALGLEDLDLDRDDVLDETGSPPPFGAPDAQEENPPPDSLALDEDTLSIELADLLEIETESESADEYVNEEALTLEVESAKLELEEFPEELEVSETTPEPEAPFVFTESDDQKTGEDEVTFDLIPDTPPPYQEELDKLFSLDDLKKDKIGEYRIPGELDPLPGTKPEDSSGTGVPSSEPSGVWSEIEKDLEELDFDIDGSK
jgi:hypothetical protein